MYSILKGLILGPLLILGFGYTIIIKLNYFTFKSCSISIIKNGSKHRNPIFEVTESYLYNGEENPILLKQEYEMIFSCNFDLVWYPFDTQNCYIQVDIYSVNFQVQ